MNKILSKVAEGLIIGVMVAIVGSLTGILWNKYHEATEELNNARELLEIQIVGQNIVQANINDTFSKYMKSSLKFKTETTLKFIEQQNETNQSIQMALSNLQKVLVVNMKESLEKAGTDFRKITPTSHRETGGVSFRGPGGVLLPKTGTESLPESKPLESRVFKPIVLKPVKTPTITELDKDNKRLEQLETYQMEQGVLQQEQIQIQQQIKR